MVKRTENFLNVNFGSRKSVRSREMICLSSSKSNIRNYFYIAFIPILNVFKQQQAIPLQRNKDLNVMMTRSSLKLQVPVLLKVNYKYHQLNNDDRHKLNKAACKRVVA